MNPSPVLGCEHLQGRHRHSVQVFTEVPIEVSESAMTGGKQWKL